MLANMSRFQRSGVCHTNRVVLNSFIYIFMHIYVKVQEPNFGDLRTYRMKVLGHCNHCHHCYHCNPNHNFHHYRNFNHCHHCHLREGVSPGCEQGDGSMAAGGGTTRLNKGRTLLLITVISVLMKQTRAGEE